VDGVDGLFLGHADDAVDVEVGRDWTFAGADLIGFVGLVAVNAEPVLVREDRHGPQIQLGAGPENADRNLAAVGRHQFPHRTDLDGDGRLW
jgi:hypothetical protein